MLDNSKAPPAAADDFEDPPAAAGVPAAVRRDVNDLPPENRAYACGVWRLGPPDRAPTHKDGLSLVRQVEIQELRLEAIAVDEGIPFGGKSPAATGRGRKGGRRS